MYSELKNWLTKANGLCYYIKLLGSIIFVKNLYKKDVNTAQKWYKPRCNCKYFLTIANIAVNCVHNKVYALT